MDLVAGVKRVVAVMEHTSKDGSPKILKKCTLPITGLGVVNLIITDLCVFEVKPGGGLVLIELHPGVSLEDVKAKTGTPFEPARDDRGKRSPAYSALNPNTAAGRYPMYLRVSVSK